MEPFDRFPELVESFEEQTHEDMTDYDKALSHALLMLGHESGHAKSRIADVAKLGDSGRDRDGPKGNPPRRRRGET